MRQHIMLQCKQVGNLGTNCYILANKDTKEAIVIDPGAEGYFLRDVLESNGLHLTAILLTHGHYDHIGGLADLKSCYPAAKTYASYEERAMLSNTKDNLSDAFENPCTVLADVYLHDEEALELAGIHFRCLSTPGHTPGGMCYYAIEDESVFTGDTLFAGSVGRTDFPGGDGKVLLQSLKDKLKDLPDYIKVYPGHGPSSTMEIELEQNPYF